ncbi:Fc.00g025740.m01.CDS01 [Cosmosporella sp. VM-42]
MAAKLVTSFLALFAAAHAFNVPANATDGVYVVTTNDLGEVHSRVGDLDAPYLAIKRDYILDSSVAKIRKRYNWPSGTSAKCNSAYLWSSDFYGSAFNSFYNQCFLWV